MAIRIRFTASSQVSDKSGWLFLVLWNVAALAATVMILMHLDLSRKATITFGIVGYALVGLWGGVKLLSLVNRLRR